MVVALLLAGCHGTVSFWLFLTENIHLIGFSREVCGRAASRWQCVPSVFEGKRLIP